MRMEELYRASESERERGGERGGEGGRKMKRKGGKRKQRRFGGSDSPIEESEGLERRGCASIIKGKHIHRSGGGSFAIS